MIDFLLRNQDAFIVGFIFMVAGSGLGALWSNLRDKDISKNINRRKKSLPQVVDDSEVMISPLPRNQRSHQSQPDDLIPIIYAAVAGVCLLYLYWRYEIIVTLTSIAFFLIAFFCSASIYAYIKNQIGGKGWIIYLSLILAASFYSFVLITSAIQPTYAPGSLQSMQAVFQVEGFNGLIGLFTLETVPWYLTHVTGVFLLFYMQIRMTASLAHYTSIVHIGATGKREGLPLFIARITKRYRKPKGNIILLIVLSISSYYLINGHVYVWYYSYMQ